MGRALTNEEIFGMYEDTADDLTAFFKLMESEILDILDSSEEESVDEIINKINKAME